MEFIDMENNCHADVLSVTELLEKKLKIPNYQRPYKWESRNIIEMLTDIDRAIGDYKRFGDTFKYRIGTIILYKNNDNLEIVDGQQRIISLVLLMLCLDINFNSSILKEEFRNKVSQSNIRKNYLLMREWFGLKNNEEKYIYLKQINQLLQVVVIYVKKISEAFQLFDSQNSRGKALEPHDLLKAYHLREMKFDQNEMEYAVIKWESLKPEDIKDLFNLYLFPILKWSQGNKSKTFTVKDIDVYKGISESSGYTYAKRVSKAMPCFQITEPYISGKNFFKMVDYYIGLLAIIKNEIKTNGKFIDLYNIISQKYNSTGFNYAINLFFCALLCYYDKFNNFEEIAVRKLFIWAFMIRVDMKNLGFDTINKYAIGEISKTSKYTNNIPIFIKICLSRLHFEISNLPIKSKRNPDEPENKNKWMELYNSLKKINNI